MALHEAIIDGPFTGLRRNGYGCIVADPPWHYKTYTPWTPETASQRRDVQSHYEVMSKEAIQALPVRDLAAKNCHLFLWVTSPMLPDGIDLLKVWGFRYSSIAFTWVKLKRSHKSEQLRFLPSAESDLHVGLGMTTRKNAEFCLLGRRGSPRREAKNIREIIMTPVREHSRKPEEARERVERYIGPGIPVIELFARSARPGWDCWGNETEKF